MKTKLIAITSAFFLTICSMQLSAQEQEQEAYKDGFFKRFGVAVKASTYGYGLDLSTSLAPNLKARVGFNLLNYKYSDSYEFYPDPAPGYNGDVDGTLENLDIKFPNANILFDFYPVKAGIFCITAGVYIGNNKINSQGTANGPFIWNDIVIRPENNKFDAELKVGNTVKPYFGFGLGRTISKSRLSCRFDLGLVYQGDYTLGSPQSENGKTTNGADVLKKEIEDFPEGLTDALKFWPMMSFSISYRLK